jgi:hypothetical protein
MKNGNETSGSGLATRKNGIRDHILEEFEESIAVKAHLAGSRANEKGLTDANRN